MKLLNKTFVRWSIALIVCCLFSSCYSVRLKNVYGDPEPDPKDCPNGIYIVEYRNTFGGVLLSGVTFGRKRRVRVKYVCLKPTN